MTDQSRNERGRHPSPPPFLEPGGARFPGDGVDLEGRIERVELLWSVWIEDPRDVATWGVRTGEGRRPITDDEVRSVWLADRNDWLAARELRSVERHLTNIAKQLDAD
jgi:hypothetical protein